MRYFNTAGPIRAEVNYCIDPLSRVDLDGWLHMVAASQYFVLHAPRQTGKTSVLLALRDLLNSGTAGSYRCVYANVEAGQAGRRDPDAAIRGILGEIAAEARLTLGDTFLDSAWPALFDKHGPHGAVTNALREWCEAAPAPVVLLIDEIDALVGDTLISLLRQLRTGYPRRGPQFPQSVVLCGVRDVRDYRIRSDEHDEIVTGGSPFNIKAASLRLGDFDRDAMTDLLAQHTADTGQAFTEGALSTLWERTQGQPWLVNAVGDEACFRHPPGRDRTQPLDAAAIADAAERLVVRRETHIDQLADKLAEPRVRRVIEPVLAGTAMHTFDIHDVEYVRDLGLLAHDDPLRIANPIYAEVIPRQLTYGTQSGIAHEAAWYLAADGRLDMDRLLDAFQQFFREHSEHWVERFDYKEAGPQLLLQAFLQRIVNGGGRIEREYGLGRRRTDLLVIWPTAHGTQRSVVECKLLRGTPAQTIEDGVAQTADYMDRCDADSGHLVIFDRSADTPWAEKIYCEKHRSSGGTAVTVWGA